jgi:hypothetical protein
MKHSMVAAFALAGAIALSPASQALAGETSVTLGNGDTATVQGGGNDTVYTDDGITVHLAVNDATAMPKAGDGLADGTIYAGDNFAATPADAPGSYTWVDGKRYCEDLEAHGHNDWKLPSKAELNVLFENRAKIGGFDESGSFLAGYYWSSSEYGYVSVWTQRFSDGRQGIHGKSYGLSVRCVRAELRP